MIYAMGDIHGMLAPLQHALDHLCSRPLGDEDTVVFLGDYIDRGAHSKEVMETLISWKEEHPQTVFLRGNHEQEVLDLRKELERSADQGTRLTKSFRRWQSNGGKETLESYGGSKTNWVSAIPESHWEFFKATEMEYDPEGIYLFVHAGLLPQGMAGWETLRDGDPRLWIRAPFIYSNEIFEGKYIVFGHTPQLSGKPLIMDNKVGLDTACCFGSTFPLTMGIFDPSLDFERRKEFEIVQFYQ